jgi:5-methylthioadenosine/S-adenosylhomocysteine deaminase
MRRQILTLLLVISLPGPLLLAILPPGDAAPKYALRGTVVTPQSVILNGIVVVEGNIIVAVGTTAPPGVTVIDTGGFIFPGLIDLHNHVVWNAFPRWRPKRAATSRYEWKVDADYLARLNDPHDEVMKFNECDLERYGEVKALVNGATAIVGSAGALCSKGLIRNLDLADASGFKGKVPAQYQTFPMQLDESDVKGVRDALAAGNVVIVHLAEGVTEDARNELKVLMKRGFLHPGLVVIHGVALTADDFQTLRNGGAGLVWSPRSNIELYGTTTDIKAALHAGLTIAIAPDWSPSGSAGMIPEMTFAWRWIEGTAVPLTAKAIVEMATVNAAALGGVGDKTGRIEPNYAADLLVVASNGDTNARIRSMFPILSDMFAYETLLETKPAGVKLVIVAGRPLYGDAALVAKVNPKAKMESLTVCGAEKVIDMSDSDGGKGVSLADTRHALTIAMGNLHPPVVPPMVLAGLVDCR